MKEEIKAIVFDVGGVLITERGHEVSTELSKLFDLETDLFRKLRKKYYHKSSRGQLSRAEYFRGVFRELKLESKKIRKISSLWAKLLRDKTVLEKESEIILRKLKKNYILVTLTNVSPLYEGARKEKKIYRYFDHKFISTETGLLKPYLNSYKDLIKRLKIPAKNMVFIDDKEKNIPPAKKLGMKTILFKNNGQLVNDLKKLEIKI